MGQLTGQLLEITTKPFKAIHFRQNGRLVSENRLIIEKQRALSRRAAFMQAHKAQAGPDMDYIRKVNTAFAPSSPIVQKPSPNAGGGLQGTAGAAGAPGAAQSTQSFPPGSHDAYNSSSFSSGESVSVPPVQPQSGFSEAQAAYTLQRGSFEVRAVSGDVTYIPAIEMTIITSWPEVDFTYTGGFHYVPPRDEETEGTGFNLTI